MFIDTHCHIHDRETFEFARSNQQISKKLLAKIPETPHRKEDFEPSKILDRAHTADVTKMIVVGTSMKDSVAARDFADRHENVFWSWGIHPEEARASLADPAMGIFGGEGNPIDTDSDSLVAIGEIGLDYHKGTADRNLQIKMLEALLQIAKMEDLPVIFHVRDAFDDFWPIVDNAGIEKAVIHSFSDSPENLKQALSRDFYIGVNGLATFTDDLPTPPLDRTLLETDAPFLAPVPMRGRVNEPAYIPDIAKFLAAKHDVSLEKVASTTTKNAETLFEI